MSEKMKRSGLKNQSQVDLAGCAGGVLVRVLVCVVTLMIVGGFIVLILRTFEQHKLENHRKALVISEYGLFVALQKLKDSPSWAEGIPLMPYEDGAFEVVLQRSQKDDALYMSVKSNGMTGSVVKSKECILRLEVTDEDSVWIRESMQ